ncbi:MAG: hypothetical protein RL038_553 [Actinomycetota bacterium]
MLRKVIALVVALVLQTGAAASDTYLYWSYWISENGKWTAASQGAGTTPVADKMVQGWRFVDAGVGLAADTAPRFETGFKELCGDEARVEGKVRVALVVDFGDVENDQLGTRPDSIVNCLQVAAETRSIELLYSVLQVRESAGFICALANYPATGCAGIDNTSTEPTEESSQTDVKLQFGFIALLFAGLGLIVFRNRKRKQQP